MKIDDQCCSLDLAKRLKELGVKKENLFYYDYAPHINGKPLENPILDYWGGIPWEKIHANLENKSFVSAFTCAELGELLPCYIESEGYCFELIMCFSDEEYQTNDFEEYVLVKPRSYQIGYKSLNEEIEQNESFFFEDINETNCRAKMLIYLLENGLMKND